MGLGFDRPGSDDAKTGINVVATEFIVKLAL